jgi:hypothetical protein
MYKIYKNGRLYRQYAFDTYEEARKSARRLQTALIGHYLDNLSACGLSIKRVD